MIVLGWGFLFSGGLVDFFFWSFFLCSNIMERREFSSWTWWYISGGIVPWDIFQRVFLMGWGCRGAKGHFLSYFAPFRHLLVSFSNKVFFFFLLLQPSLFPCYVRDGNMHLCISQGCIFFPVWCSMRGLFPRTAF